MFDAVVDDSTQRDRTVRYLIYALLALVIVAGLVFPMTLKMMRISPEAVDAYELVQSLPSPAYAVVVTDFTDPDGERQLTALIGHLLRNSGRLVLISVSAPAAAATERILVSSLTANRLTYGRAAVHLGWRPGDHEYLWACARGFVTGAGSRDHNGNDLWEYALMQDFRRLDEADLLVVVTDGHRIAPGDAARLASLHGVDALVAASDEAIAEASELWHEGRLAAVLPGGRAAADYEGLSHGKGAPARYFTALTLGTLFVMLLIIWAYLTGLLRRGRRRGAHGGSIC